MASPKQQQGISSANEKGKQMFLELEIKKTSKDKIKEWVKKWDGKTEPDKETGQALIEKNTISTGKTKIWADRGERANGR